MDFSYISDWLNLLFRWLHLIFGAAWIGTSFYFNWLNNHVRAPERDPKRDDDPLVGGELWSVHGGHFYRVVKYKVAPEVLPKTLHWFKWEAYLTWVTGACLLLVIYYLQADFYLVDPTVADITTGSAIALGIGTLVGGWLLYHYACKSPLVEHKVLFTVTMFSAVTAVAYLLTMFLSARAAYIHVGALLGTCMALNVFFVIIPNQRVMVQDMIDGKEPDGALGRAGALRSLHNNYMTLPVLFIMLSNHFPMTFGHRLNWAVLAAIGVVGAATRHWFNLKGRGLRNPWLAPATAGGLVALVFVMSPYAESLMVEGAGRRAQAVTFSEANQIIVTRCTPCHATKPTFPGFVAAPKGIVFETSAQIKAQLSTIEQAAVKSITMPLGNLTQMTPEERALLGQWIAEGAPTD